MTVAAIIVAAGRGTRAGGDLPKQWQPLGQMRVVDHTLARFAGHPRIDQVVLVLHPDDGALCPDVHCVPGGATRQQSVLAGLRAVEGRCTQVLIHDAARPCVTERTIDLVLDALGRSPAAAPALPVVDALWRGAGGTVTGTQDRAGLYRAQTPQGFHMDAILEAHATAAPNAADDVEIARQAGLEVSIVPGDETNIKITHPDDFRRAQQILEAQMDIRIGTGFDVHRFGEGDHVVLCGVQVAHDRGLQGHSDADVGMHALTDAIYGALADGDIGQHFPPSDPQWKGAESHIFLRHAIERAQGAGYKLGNCDITLICEYPKIGPHAQAMRTQLARIMGTDISRVSVKATTSERLGFTGRQEGIAAQAAVTLVSL